MGLEAVLIWFVVAIQLGRYVHDGRHGGANALPPVIYEVRNLHEGWVLRAEKELVHCTFGLGIITRVNQDELHHAADAGEVIDLMLVVVPRLNDSRVGGRDVHLTELRKELRVIGAEDVHQPAPLIRDESKFLGLNSLDQRRLAGQRLVSDWISHDFSLSGVWSTTRPTTIACQPLSCRRA